MPLRLNCKTGARLDFQVTGNPNKREIVPCTMRLCLKACGSLHLRSVHSPCTVCDLSKVPSLSIQYHLGTKAAMQQSG